MEVLPGKMASHEIVLHVKLSPASYGADVKTPDEG
jgi:hypothetical protein